MGKAVANTAGAVVDAVAKTTGKVVKTVEKAASDFISFLNPFDGLGAAGGDDAIEGAIGTVLTAIWPAIDESLVLAITTITEWGVGLATGTSAIGGAIWKLVSNPDDADAQKQIRELALTQAQSVVSNGVLQRNLLQQQAQTPVQAVVTAAPPSPTTVPAVSSVVAGNGPLLALGAVALGVGAVVLLKRKRKNPRRRRAA